MSKSYSTPIQESAACKVSERIKAYGKKGAQVFQELFEEKVDSYSQQREISPAEPDSSLVLFTMPVDSSNK